MWPKAGHSPESASPSLPFYTLVDTFSLPHISLSAELLITHLNPLAIRLFGPLQPHRHLSHLLRQLETPPGGERNSWLGEMKLLEGASRAVGSVDQPALDFGQGTRIKLWMDTEDRGRTAIYFQCLVQKLAPTSGVVMDESLAYAITILRRSPVRIDTNSVAGSGSIRSISSKSSRGGPRAMSVGSGVEGDSSELAIDSETRCGTCGRGTEPEPTPEEEMIEEEEVASDEEEEEVEEESAPFRGMGDHLDSLKALGHVELPVERLREIINNVPQIVFVTDPTGLVEFFNSQFFSLTGVDREEALSDPDVLFPIFHPDDMQHTAAAWYESLSSGTPLSVEYRIRAASGNYIWLATRSNPIYDDEGKISSWVATSTEIDDLVTARADALLLVDATLAIAQQNIVQAELVASENAAILASKLKTEFVQNMSHEIRTPIACMLGIAELLLDDTTLRDDHRVLLTKSLNAGEMLLDLVGMVLDLGKIESMKMTLEVAPFQLKNIIHDASSLVFPLSPRVHYTSDVSHYPGELLGDAVRLRQVLANLISNAKKFTMAGTISLFVRTTESPEEVFATFTVVDTGVGVELEAMPRLFQSFEQSDPSTVRRYGGSGLGLRISRDLCELMGGTIEMQSTFGVGTSVCVQIPFKKVGYPHERSQELVIAEDNSGVRTPVSKRSLESFSEIPPSIDAPSSPPVLLRRAPLQASEVKILIADDNDLIREILTRTLLKMKFQVRAVADGLQCLDALAADSFDLLLLDGQMPILSGYDCARAIRRSPISRIRNIRVIALTASAIAGDRKRCLEAGMDDYLSKPVRNRDLEQAIWAQLQRDV